MQKYAKIISMINATINKMTRINSIFCIKIDVYVAVTVTGGKFVEIVVDGANVIAVVAPAVVVESIFFFFVVVVVNFVCFSISAILDILMIGFLLLNEIKN